jgi:hypothetical protein
MAACDGPRCGPHHHAIPCARSLPAWCVLAYVSVREKKPHVGEHRNVLVVRNLHIIRKYDRVSTVLKNVQYSYMYCTGANGHECIRVLEIRFCVLWMEIRVLFGLQNFVLLPSSFSFNFFLINILSQYSLVFVKNKLSICFFGRKFC